MKRSFKCTLISGGISRIIIICLGMESPAELAVFPKSSSKSGKSRNSILVSSLFRWAVQETKAVSSLWLWDGLESMTPVSRTVSCCTRCRAHSACVCVCESGLGHRIPHTHIHTLYQAPGHAHHHGGGPRRHPGARVSARHTDALSQCMTLALNAEGNRCSMPFPMQFLGSLEIILDMSVTGRRVCVCEYLPECSGRFSNLYLTVCLCSIFIAVSRYFRASLIHFEILM